MPTPYLIMEASVNKEAKRQLVKDLERKTQQMQGVIFTDYRGLTVEQISRLRNELRQVGVEYHVEKNTLVKRALAGIEEGQEVLGQLLTGPTAIAFSQEEPIPAAKIIKTFAAANKDLEIKGGLLGATVMGKEEVMQLAALPGREELLAKLFAGMQAPITGFVRTLGGIIPQFVRTLDAIRQQKSE